MTRRSTLCLLVGLCFTATAASEDRYNPFAGTAPKAPETGSATGTPGTGASAAPGKVTHLTLKAVIPNGNPPMANIDGTILAVGEKIGSYTLVSVGEQGVTLMRGGRRVQLMFEYGNKKEAPPAAPASTALPGART